MVKIYMGLILFVIIFSLFEQGVVEYIAPSIAPYATYIYLFVMAILLLLYFYESYLKHPIRKTKATVKNMHIFSSRLWTTFTLPNGKTCKLMMSTDAAYFSLNVGDEVMLTYKGNTAIKVVPMHKK